MSKYTIYHNPRCRKSRETLGIMNENSIDPEITLYLEDQLSADEIKVLLEKLDMKASALIRKGEAIYKEKFRGKEMSEQDWIHAMVMYPKLIERPIVVKGKKAVLGRPPENVLDLIG